MSELQAMALGCIKIKFLKKNYIASCVCTLEHSHESNLKNYHENYLAILSTTKSSNASVLSNSPMYLSFKKNLDP